MDTVSWHPLVVDTDEYRTLQFNELDIQSRMRLAAPDELVLSYTRTMAAFMLFEAAPREVLVVGLGGGSLSKFCHRHLPETRVTTVEISREVIDLRDAFCIPPDSDRFRVVHADITRWLAGRNAVADVILLDGYGGDGVPDAIAGEDFYACCARALTAGGMLVANINLGASDRIDELRWMQTLFAGRAIALRSAAGHNEILFGFRAAALPAVRELKRRAIALRDRTGVDFPLLLDGLRSAAGTDVSLR